MCVVVDALGEPAATATVPSSPTGAGSKFEVEEQAEQEEKVALELVPRPRREAKGMLLSILPTDHPQAIA